MSINAAGSLIQIASAALGTAKNMTAVSNATAAVATLEASHGVIVGDYVYVTSGWNGLNGRVPRASVVATNDVTLEGVNTANTTRYPAGGGTGTVQEIPGWTTVTRVAKDVEFGGGQQNFNDVTELADFASERQLPGRRGAYVLTLSVFQQGTEPAWMTTVRSASDSDSPVPCRIVQNSGGIIVGAAYWRLGLSPAIEGDTWRWPLVVAFDGQPLFYAS